MAELYNDDYYDQVASRMCRTFRTCIKTDSINWAAARALCGPECRQAP